MAVSQVQRTIRFVAWRDVLNRPEFELGRFEEVVAAFDGGNWKLADSDMTTGATVPRSGDPLCLQYFRLRERGDLPSRINVDRETLALELPTGDAITDWLHVVIWTDGYAACDPHRDAPTLSRLEWYARQKANQYVKFVNLYDRRLIERLQELDELTALDLRIAKSDAAQAVDDAELGMLGALFALYRGSESARLDASLSVGRSRKRQLSEDVREDVISLAERAAELLDNLVVRGRLDGRSVELDLLKQRIQRRVRVPRIHPDVRAPEPNAVFDRIIQLRQELDSDETLALATRASAA